jgi:hypothetical protein
VSDVLVLLLVLLLVASGYTAGRVHGQIGYRAGYRSGYRQGYADGTRGRPVRLGDATPADTRITVAAATGEVQVIGSDDHERSERRQLPVVPHAAVHRVRRAQG